ncbi:hypothetical protein R5M92_11945 [Halomonas sp. Bachu 37]|uniref:hypothetical protein n=1 Tax=Halomonas kashgarensis TaxID=3084920 RepID=UPI003217EAB5
MKTQRISKLLAPALLALAVAPFALTVQAGPYGDKTGNGFDREEMQQRHAEFRQTLHERAGLDDATREELNGAHEEHWAAMRELHEQHRAQVDEILDDEQQAALEDAMQEMREEFRDGHGKPGRHHGDRRGSDDTEE